MTKKDFFEQYRDPRWQKKRLEILNRDSFTCRMCNSDLETLHVHHIKYLKNKPPWESPNKDLLTLCKYCHGFVGELKLNGSQMKQVRVLNYYEPDTGLSDIFYSYNGSIIQLRVGKEWALGFNSVDLLVDFRSLINHTIRSHGKKDD